MQTFIFGLLLAAVSATTVVAFKHPKGFARLFPYLLGTATILFAGITLWQLAVEITWSNLDQYMAIELLADAEIGKEQLSLPYIWIALWYLATVLFLLINLKLPAFLQITDEDSSSGEGRETNLGGQK